jgi:hypothetical protein
MEERTMFFHDFLGGITENIMPSEKGSRLSTSSSSAFPPSVIICASHAISKIVKRPQNSNRPGTSP